MRHLTLFGAVAVGILVLAMGDDARAKAEFGPMVDQFCTDNQRIPPTPFADLKGNLPLQECQLCHQPGTFNKRDTIEPNFTEFENARKNGGDYSFFCPQAVVANAPPVLTTIGNRTVNQGALLQIAVTASDADNDPLAFSVTGTPNGASFGDNGDGTALFSWTPGPNQSGNYALTFAVTDNALPPLSDAESIIIAVVAQNDAVNRRPLLLTIGNKMGTSDQTLTFSVRATDPDGNQITLKAGPPLPAGAAFIQTGRMAGNATGVFTWTPTADQAGDHAVAFTALDNGDPAETDSEWIRISIAGPAAGPPAPPAPPMPMPPNAPDLYISEAEWKAGAGRLHVEGEGAGDYATVDLLDADSGALIGYGTSDEDGEFELRLRPVPVPCAVQARVGDAVGNPVAVEDSPSDCGSGGAVAIRLKKAEWKRGKRELRVEGDRAPPGATVDIYNADDDTHIATVIVRSNGKFRYRGRYAPPPCDVAIEVDGYPLGAMTVKSGPCHRESAYDDDHEEEDDD